MMKEALTSTHGLHKRNVPAALEDQKGRQAEVGATLAHGFLGDGGACSPIPLDGGAGVTACGWIALSQALRTSRRAAGRST